MSTRVRIVTGSIPQSTLAKLVARSFKRAHAGKGMSGCVQCGNRVEDPENTNVCNKCLKKLFE